MNAINKSVFDFVAEHPQGVAGIKIQQRFSNIPRATLDNILRYHLRDMVIGCRKGNFCYYRVKDGSVFELADDRGTDKLSQAEKLHLKALEDKTTALMKKGFYRRALTIWHSAAKDRFGFNPNIADILARKISFTESQIKRCQVTEYSGVTYHNCGIDL